MKDDERLFAEMCVRLPGPAVPRRIIEAEGWPVNHKRCWGFLGKWSDRGWYDYGVCLDCGWMEPKGRVAIAAVLAKEGRHPDADAWVRAVAG